MKLSRLNPFFVLTEINEKPFSRLYRTSFLQKMKDTFYIIAGNRGFFEAIIQESEQETFSKTATYNIQMISRFLGFLKANTDIHANKEHIGLLDYVTLQITRGINKLTTWCYRSFPDPIALSIIVPATLAFVIANTLHYSLASIATLLASPIVGAVHIASQLFGGLSIKKQAKALAITVQDKNKYELQNIRENMASYLKETGQSFNNIIISLKTSKNPNKPAKLLFMTQTMVGAECCKVGKCLHQKGHIQVKAKLDNLDSQQKKSLRALLALNAGGIYSNLKEKGHLESFEAFIMDRDNNITETPNEQARLLL